MFPAGKKNHTDRTHKVYPDGADVAVRERIVSETQQQARLAHAGIADQDKFEKVIAAQKKKRRDTRANDSRQGGGRAAVSGAVVFCHSLNRGR